MSSEPAEAADTAQVIKTLQEQILGLTEVCVRLASANNALRTELRRVLDEQDTAEQPPPEK